MKKITFLSLFLITVITMAQTNLTKNLGDFSELKVFNGIEVELISAPKNKIEISGDKASKVRIVNNGKTLKISLKFPDITANGKAIVKLYYAKNIQNIDANEGAIITGKGIAQASLIVKVQEGAFVNLVAKVNNLKVKASSGGVLKLSGKSKNQVVDVDLGGVYHGYNMLVGNMSVVRAGSGAKAEIYTSQTLDAKVTFGGSIYYKGNPTVLKDKKVIGGVIEQRS